MLDVKSVRLQGIGRLELGASEGGFAGQATLISEVEVVAEDSGGAFFEAVGISDAGGGGVVYVPGDRAAVVGVELAFAVSAACGAAERDAGSVRRDGDFGVLGVVCCAAGCAKTEMSEVG